MSSREDVVIFAGMTLRRTDVANTAVPVIEVVPTQNIGRPQPRLFEIPKALGRKLWPVLRGTKQRLAK